MINLNLIQSTFVLTTNTHANNFSSNKISMLVDFVRVNKSQLFRSLSSSLFYGDKNRVWKDIAKEISEEHGTFRKGEDV